MQFSTRLQCQLPAIPIACAKDIVSTASDPIVTNHAGADRLLRTEPQVQLTMLNNR
jgi:hypothetical protein